MVASLASLYHRSHGEICQTRFFGVSRSRYELNGAMQTMERTQCSIRVGEVRANGFVGFYDNKE